MNEVTAEPFGPGERTTPEKRGLWGAQLTTSDVSSSYDSVVVTNLAKAFGVEAIISTEPKGYNAPQPLIIWGIRNSCWYKVATLYIQGFVGCCGAAIVASCHPQDFEHTPARLDALIAGYCYMARKLGYTRLLTTEIEAAANAKREKEAYIRAGFKVIEEFTNMNTSNQVYILSKATRG